MVGGEFVADSPQTFDVTDPSKIYFDVTDGKCYRVVESGLNTEYVQINTTDLSNYYNKTQSDTRYAAASAIPTSTS